MKKKETLTQKVANAIKNDLLSSREINHGEFLPPERELALQFNVSRVTIRLSLKLLVKNGILEVVPQKGYRFIRELDSVSMGILAYVIDTIKPGESLDPISEQILTAFNRILIVKQQQMLSIGIKGVLPDITFFQNLKKQNIKAIILDCNRPDVIDAASNCGIPCVLINSFTLNEQIDSIIQANFYGSYKAVQYLLDKKHVRIVWLGPTKGNAHYRERYSGARAAMENAGLEFFDTFSDNHSNDTAKELLNVEAYIIKILKQKNAPTAFVCMWQPLAESTVNAIRKAGLTVGNQIDLIGWATEYEYREVFLQKFLNEKTPAMMIWSPNEMASVGLEILERRLKSPAAPFIRVEIKSRIQLPQDANKALQTKYLV